MSKQQGRRAREILRSAGPQSSPHLTLALYRLGTVCADNGTAGAAVPLEGGPRGDGLEGVQGGLCGVDHFISIREGAFRVLELRH